MPIVSGGAGGSTFNGGTLTTPVLMEAGDKDAAPLQLRPVVGATADATNQIELHDDLGNLIGWWDAAGNFATGSSPDSDKSLQWFSDDGFNLSRAFDSQTVIMGFGSDNQLAFKFRLSHPPLDADVPAQFCALWFDPTNGAAKLMVKAKQADGTVVTGSLALA